MPLNWSTTPHSRLFIVTDEGMVTRADIAPYLAGTIHEGAKGQAKLVDIRTCTLVTPTIWRPSPTCSSSKAKANTGSGCHGRGLRSHPRHGGPAETTRRRASVSHLYQCRPCALLVDELAGEPGLPEIPGRPSSKTPADPLSRLVNSRLAWPAQSG